ncbi:CapA family protein [Sediminibacillus albus]|uniref:Poly-gamma-glutamate synthesis protein (Capsule biosynthesis protein) n=1 Tax=Sediminibacillus albus TaxID=407036 RepID=A0A1G9ATC2_9BACI|nr:CapA family protein [Sediminibacillus albus]SDK30568.1 poly-gamma-glutamate synthesis protein (capsule biosynthesis protein) [Sediminibacillus albus]
MIKRKIILAASILFLLSLFACNQQENGAETETSPANMGNDTSASEENKAADDSAKENASQEQKQESQKLSITAIGDILVHASVYNDAKTKEGYDFLPMFEKVKPYLGDTSITMANQETMIGGADVGLSDYPSFNSPYEVGNALKEVGVDIVTIANNHTLDRGEEAIQSAISHWEDIDMRYTGAYKSKEDSANIRVLSTEADINVAFLSYTYGTNGIPVPEGKDYLVNYIDKQKIVEDIESAKELADVIILSYHFGTEYQDMPSKEQKELVQLAADHHVHAVIGHHPHVLQPVDWVEGKDGNRTFAAYSLGNFLSGQDEFYNQIGGILKFDIEKMDEEQAKGGQDFEVTAPRFLPTYVKFTGWKNFKVLPMYQLTNNELADAQLHYQQVKDHMSQWVPELKFIEE